MEKQRSLLLFESSLKSTATRDCYSYYLNKFKDYNKLKDYDSILTLDTKQLTRMLEDFVLFLRKKISPNTIPTQMFAIQSFLEINDITINWKRIKRLYPAKIKLTGLKPWSTDDVRKMLQCAPDVRARSLIHFLASSGIRIGALQDLQLKHISEMPNKCKSILVYPDSREEYYTFLTPEASKVLDEYFAKRRKDGEHLTPNSPVFRIAYQIGITPSKPISKETAECIIRRTVHNAALRPHKVGSRYDIQQNHGFRKRFNTILKLNNKVNSNVAEKLMGHKNGLDGVYLTPSKNELFQEFQKAISDLTIDPTEKQKIKIEDLEKQNSKLELLYKDAIASLGDRVMSLEKERDYFKSQKLTLP